MSKAVIELKRHTARPAGCSFLGARATETLASLDDPEGELVPIIIDLGSDTVRDKTVQMFCDVGVFLQ